MVTQREPGDSPKEQNEAQEGPEVRGNETQESQRGTKGEQEGNERTRMASIVPRRIPKGSKRRPREPKGAWDATGGAGG